MQILESAGLINSMIQTLSISVSGKVQGVFFRQSTKEKADELGLEGTVKNLPDGSVEIIATGSEENLSQLVEWCHIGPKKAKVSTVETRILPLQYFKRFTIAR